VRGKRARMYNMRTSTLRPGTVGKNDGRDGACFGRWCFKSGDR
jgi:hypothetical protein